MRGSWCWCLNARAQTRVSVSVSRGEVQSTVSNELQPSSRQGWGVRGLHIYATRCRMHRQGTHCCLPRRYTESVLCTGDIWFSTLPRPGDFTVHLYESHQLHCRPALPGERGEHISAVTRSPLCHRSREL